MSKLTLLTYNFNNNVSPLFYYKNNEFVKNFIIFFTNEINKYPNFLNIFNNVKLEFIVRNRFSILYNIIPINMNYTKFLIEWNKYMNLQFTDDINIKLSKYNISEQIFKTNLVFYDWLIYKYIKYFSQTDYFYLYQNRDIINITKISKLIKLINTQQPYIIFLQNIDSNQVFIDIGEYINYNIYWLNNMAILINNADFNLNTNELEIDTNNFEPFQIIIQNQDLILISGFNDTTIVPVCPIPATLLTNIFG